MYTVLITFESLLCCVCVSQHCFIIDRHSSLDLSLRTDAVKKMTFKLVSSLLNSINEIGHFVQKVILLTGTTRKLFGITCLVKTVSEWEIACQILT